VCVIVQFAVISTLFTYSSVIALCGFILLMVQLLLCSYLTVAYYNSLCLFGYYSLIVYTKPLLASDLVIEHPFQCLMDPYYLCFYSIVISNWHTTLLSCLLVAIQVIFVFLSLLVMLNNYLYYFHLPVVSELICLPKSCIICTMC